MRRALNLLLALLFFSCVSYEEKTAFKEDFSGTSTLRFTVPELMAPQLDADFYALKEKAGSEVSPGVVLLKALRRQEEEKVSYELVVSFKTPEAFARFLTRRDKRETLKVEEGEDGIYFSRRVETDEKLGPSLLVYPLADFPWTYETTFPYRVLETDGKLLADGKSVLWEFDLYTLLASGRLEMSAKLEKPSTFERLLLRLKRELEGLLKRLGLK